MGNSMSRPTRPPSPLLPPPVEREMAETLDKLSSEELDNFKSLIEVEKDFPTHSRSRLKVANRQDVVELMLKTYSQECVEKTKKVLKKMNRTDRVQSFSDVSSGTKEQHCEQQRKLIPHEEKRLIIEKLLKTMNNLSCSEFEKFKWILQLTYFQRGDPQIQREQMEKVTSAVHLVDVMVERDGLRSVEVIEEVFRDMNRTDLVKELTASGDKDSGVCIPEKVGHCFALIQKEEMMERVIKRLLETLAGLSDREFKNFKMPLFMEIEFYKRHTDITWELLRETDKQETVLLMVQAFGQQSEEVTKTILEGMGRTDLVKRLSDNRSGTTEMLSVGHCCQALILKVEAMAAFNELLLETLHDLSDEELRKFQKVLERIDIVSGNEKVPWILIATACREDIVDVMVENYGQQSLEMIKKVLLKMNRTDLVQRMSEISSDHGRSKPSRSKKPPYLLLQKEEDVTSVEEKLLETLEDLSYTELEQFKWILRHNEKKRGLPRIQRNLMEVVHSVELVELMVETYGEESLDLTREVLKEMNRTDLLQMLSETSSKIVGRMWGASRNLELEGHGSTMPESGNWTKLDPEVNSTDADERPTYSLQSEAGNFECSVSGLRWVCKEKVSLKFQFISWEGHMERMESIEYMAAGPLMDITVISGKLEEVYLPHWICIDDNPTILDKFAVLHIDDCGDVVEKASEVTPSHVKLSGTSFSPRAVLMKAGFPVKINCNVLIYRMDTAFLTLHVYLIPRDPGLQQAMDKRELSDGNKIIRKPHPEKPFKMHNRFILTADVEAAKISPESLKLRYDGSIPNFFEMFIESPPTTFKLSLTQKDQPQPVWTNEIREGEYQRTGYSKEKEAGGQSSKPAATERKHFVDEHQCDLISRVSNIEQILDNLLRDGAIQQEEYDQIREIPTTQEKMRKIYSGPLKAGGHESKEIFYKILEEMEPFLVKDLKRKQS